MDLSRGASSATPLRNRSNILFRLTRTFCDPSSWSGPNVGTGSDPTREIQNRSCDSRHQNRVPTVWRTAATISVPDFAAGCPFGPRYDWQHRKSWEIAVIAIQVTGAA